MGYVGFLIGSEAMTDALFLLDTDHDDVPVNSDELNAGWRLTLPSSVRRHAIQAMRLKDGDELQLSDGRGLRIHAVLRDAQQGIAEVRRFGKEPQPGTRLAPGSYTPLTLPTHRRLSSGGGGVRLKG